MLYATWSAPVNASLETIWNHLLDKMENPHKYIPYEVEFYKVWEKYPDGGILREIKTSEMHMKERTYVNKEEGSVTFHLVDHPIFTGTIANKVTSPEVHKSGPVPIVTYTIDLKPSSNTAEQHPDAKWFIEAAKPKKIQGAVMQLKSILEGENTNNQAPVPSALRPPATTTAGSSGEMSNLVRQLFKAGESMNIDNFVKFYANDGLYQFSNFPIVYGPQGIREASGEFIKTVEKVIHHIKNMWEIGEDTVVCEMEVTYIRFDGKVFTLPCCDTILIKGGKIQELRIYMDISPVFAA
ncbi:nuclear transport factor 2 family protein [Argonema antarcticum]|uniref:nuclear transport factor 2 family protein n=1 Tax=Argonema antarcticum TaxID=2942763 RepID=UPI002012AA6B|nr:nuclear transport factor 2 family protein [Argonema antarcticum]MCL1470592.1 nuclear transport factor 2 family protein [Argonema antarcticum A004/B2]